MGSGAELDPIGFVFVKSSATRVYGKTMDNAAGCRGRRAFVGHFSMEGKNLTRQIEYLER